MKGRYTLLLVLALLVAGALYFFLLPGRRPAAKNARPYEKMTLETWQRLEVKAPEKQPVILVKREGKWHLDGNDQCRVKEEMVAKMVAALVKMRFTDLVTSSREKFADYHVDEKKGIMVRGQTSRGPVELVIGKVAGDFLHTYVRPGDRPAVFRINGMPAHLFSHDPADFCQAEEEKAKGSASEDSAAEKRQLPAAGEKKPAPAAGKQLPGPQKK